VAAGVLAALTVVLVLAAPQRSIPLGATNLSEEAKYDSVFASAAVGPDGDRVAAIWVEEVAGVERARGSLWLRWASESTGGGWSDRLSVFEGGASACAVNAAAVAVTDTLAHVAYLVWSPCVENTERSVISYTVCHLVEGGDCDAAQTVVSATSVLPEYLPRLVGLDIALDNEGGPHFVYAMYDPTGTSPVIYYREGVSQPAEQVPDSVASLNPAIAWFNGDVHVVWEEEVGGGGFEIVYNRRGSGGGWAHPATPPSSYATAAKHPRNPDVAAYGGEVVVTWDWQWTAQADQYVLAYTRYLTDEHRWMDTYEVGTQGGVVDPLILGDFGFREPPYYTYTSKVDPLLPAYSYLQPVVALDWKGLPAVIWHADRGGTYDIMYSWAQSMTTSTAGDSIFSWSEPAVFNRSSQGDFVSPVLAEALVVSPTLHVVYLRRPTGDWETYYEGREAGVEPGSPADFPYSVYLPLVLRGFIGVDW